MNVPHWDTGRYFMVFLASVFVYLTYERIKPFKSVVEKICLEVFLKPNPNYCYHDKRE